MSPIAEDSTMSPPVPRTAMVFAAGLGARMRPITDALPKPLVKVGGRALIDYCLDRLSDNGVERAIVNVHWLADQVEAHLAERRSPKIIFSDERSKLLDQGGAIKRALPTIGGEPFLICNTDAFWIEGPRSNLARLAEAFDPTAMDVLLLVAASAGAVGVDWPGDFTMGRDGALAPREFRHVAPFVYAGVGIVKPELFASEREEVFRLAPFFHAAAAKGRLYGVRLDGLWVHVGRPETIAEAEIAIDRSIL
jgi:N-acetyl-alpha-D-muramate 1-phosphate uridylyltransferase